MIVFPAIDIRGGKCVRLQEGDFNRETVFSDDPVQMAVDFEKNGSQYLHVIDLDGAKGDGENNRGIIQEIASTLSLPIQTGGGIRSVEQIESMLSAGVDRVILGTVAFDDPEFLRKACSDFNGSVAVSIDVKNGMIATHGWQKVTDIRDLDYIKRIEDWGVSAIVYTDISRDGMLKGINLESLLEINGATEIPIIASGGVTTIHDIAACRKADLYGVIIGRALYSGTVTFNELRPYFNTA